MNFSMKQNFSQFLVVVFVVVCCLLRATTSAPTTVQPNTSDMANVHDAFFSKPSNAPSSGQEIDAAVAPFINHLYGDRSCPSTLPNTGDQEQRATCPWYYVINHDDNRFPADIAEARCRCARCIDGHTANQCERVFYHQLVLHRVGKKDGMYRWEPAWERIATGCTCAMPVTRTAASADPEPMLD